MHRRGPALLACNRGHGTAGAAAAPVRATSARKEREMGRVEVDGVGIEYDVTGQGRPVLLLHGFPDSGRLWRHQVPALAGAGFSVIVPDLRGYGRSDKPEAIEAYSLPLLGGDVMAILAELNIANAHVVGHDWGAALGWVLACLAPEKVDHLVALSVGNPVTFRRTLAQREKSWYMLLFQFPGIAERWLTEDNWANLGWRLAQSRI
jgi:pimeloyl-ACP methyl ester carboxylesterase